MSSSSEAVMPEPTLTPLATPELRSGTWTRFGGASVLGDAVTEETLNALAESTRTAARSQGYAIGWAEGQRAARTAAAAEAELVEDRRRAEDLHRSQEHAAALDALVAAAGELRAEAARVAAVLAEEASGLALDLTRTILGPLARDLDPVRRALDLTPDGDLARLVLNPEDAAAITPEQTATLAGLGVNVITDATLARGDAIAEATEHVLDLRIGAALERVAEVLR